MVRGWCEATRSVPLKGDNTPQGDHADSIAICVGKRRGYDEVGPLLIRGGKVRGRSVSLTHLYYEWRPALVELCFHAATDMISGESRSWV